MTAGPQFLGALSLPIVHTPEGEAPPGVDLQLWLQGNEAALTTTPLIEQGSLREARGSLEHAADLFTRAGDRRQAIACKAVVADIVLREGLVAEALAMYESTCAAARGNGDADIEAISLLRAAALYKLAGDTEIFEAYSKRAAVIAPEIADAAQIRPTVAPPPPAPAWLQGSGPFAGEVAGEMLKLADKLSRANSDADLRFFALWMKGEVLGMRDEYGPATKAFTDALLAAEAIDGGTTADPVNRLQFISALLGRAASRVALGQPGEAFGDIDEVFRLVPPRSGPKGADCEPADYWMEESLRIQCCNIAGEAFLLLGRAEDAEASMREALDACLTWQGVGLPKDTFREVVNALGKCASSLGKLLLETHRPESALETMRIALSAFETTGDQNGQATAHLETANALSAIERRDAAATTTSRAASTPLSPEAISHFDAAEDFSQKIGSRDGMAAIAGTRGVVLLNAGWPAQALNSLRKAANLHRETGSADGLCQDRHFEGYAYWDLGMHDRAREAFKEAYRIAGENALSELEWMAASALGVLEESLGEFGAAREPLESAVAVIESQRVGLVTEGHKFRFFINREHVYGALVRVLLALGQADLAFHAVERSRSRALLDLMRTASFHSAVAVPPQWLQEEALLMEQERVALRAIATAAERNAPMKRALHRQAQEAKRSLDLLLERICSVAPEYAALRRGDPASFEDAARLAEGSRRTVLIEYHLGKHEVEIFGIIPGTDRPEVATVPLDISELRRFVRMSFGAHSKVRELVADGLEDLWHAYDSLVEPVGQWARPGDVVCLIPHGLLHYLPMHALQVGGNYLIERNPVVYAPSASVLKFCRAKRKPRLRPMSASRVAVFGDSRSDLPMARREAEQVARMFGVAPLLDKDVDRKALLAAMPTVDLLHFAGHGYFDPADSLGSGLRLAGGEVLTAREILDMSGDFQLRLVALSGCETGINEQAPGDELLGLTRALLFAGAPTLLMSLWRVSDESASLLMNRFYAHLCDGEIELTAAEALQRAMLDTKEKYPLLDQWAPFTLVGSWD